MTRPMKRLLLGGLSAAALAYVATPALAVPVDYAEADGTRSAAGVSNPMPMRCMSGCSSGGGVVTGSLTPVDGTSLDTAVVGGQRGNLVADTCTPGTVNGLTTFTCAVGQSFAYLGAGYKTLDVSTGSTAAAATVTQKCGNTIGSYFGSTSWSPSTSGDAKQFNNNPGIYCQIAVTVLASSTITFTPALRN